MMLEIFGPGWGNYSIQGIVEIEIPDPVSLFPETWGWKLLVFCFFMWAVFKTYVLLRRRWQNRYRKVGVDALLAIKQASQSGDSNRLRELPVLIKSIALKAFPRTEVASLTGVEWERFIEQSYSGAAFADDEKGLLHHLAFNPDLTDRAPTENYWEKLQLWIENHRGQYD